MNVLQLISSGGGLYGAEQVVVTLSAQLAAMGARVTVGSFRNVAKSRQANILCAAAGRGLDTAELVCGGRLDWSTVRSIRDLVARRRIDIVHSHGPKANLYAAAAGRSGGNRLVSTCHSSCCETTFDRVIALVDRAVLPAFDRVAIVSDTIRRTLRYSCVRRGRIVTIPNGIDWGRFASGARTVPDDYRWGRRIVVGTAARLSPAKGLPHLLRTIGAVAARCPDVLFVIAGDGPDREELLRLAGELGVLRHVRFIGARSDMPEFYASLDVFVLPSLDEGMPMALLEAMASGLPVVATTVGSVPLVVQDQANGLLVAPADVAGLAGALRRLVHDPALRARLGRAARCTVESRFSAPVMAGHYAHVYDAVLSEHTQ